MNTVTLCENTFDPSTWRTVENVKDVRDFLMDHFGVWPETAKIYLNHVADNADITPRDDAGVERLGKAKGHFYIVVYPKGLETILLIVALTVAAVAVGLSFLLRPSANTKTQQQSSPNNELSSRSNQARPNQRIPDIFGQIRATFDLLAVPYRTFVNNDQEYEHCYMCIGRGRYQVDLDSVRDDVTPLNQILGATAGIYDPSNAPFHGAVASTIGSYLGEHVVNLQEFTAVTGQVLQAPNINSRKGNNNIRFVYPNIIEIDPGSSFAFEFDFFAGDEITIGGLVLNDDEAIDPGGVQSPLHLNGTYTIDFLDTPSGGGGFKKIHLLNPATVNANWTSLAAFDSGAGDSTYRSINLLANGVFEVGPFTLLYPQMTEVWCNFVGLQGVYKIDADGNQQMVTATIQVTVQACDPTGAPVGSPFNTNCTLQENTTHDRVAVGTTLKIVLPLGFAAGGGIIISARRTSNTDVGVGVQSSDEITWRDCYIISPTGLTDFGNVTTIQTIIRNTSSAAAVKDRKLNALVTRIVPLLVSGGFSVPTATKDAGSILAFMCTDPFIGNMGGADFDLQGFWNLLGPGQIIQNYFLVLGYLSAPTEFCYCFDDSKVSFEEAVQDIAQAIFCVAYRRGRVLTLAFEMKTPNSTILFNHRNKIPRSETRTVTFGGPIDNDGITLDYVEPNAANYPNLDTPQTLYFPSDKSAKNPKKVTAIGVRNFYQASLLGYRMWRKLQYQNTTVQFDATQEAALCVLQDRILVADNTRSDTQDGEVNVQAALLLTLSQNVVFDGTHAYTIFLQHPDGTIESIAITAGPNPNQVVLASAPSVALVTDQANFAKTTYIIVNNSNVRQQTFLLSEKTPKDNLTYELKAVNYDDKYYDFDRNFITNTNVAQLVLEALIRGGTPMVDVAQIVLEVLIR